MYTQLMALTKIAKLKFFALIIGFVGSAQAGETSVDFSMNCNPIEGQSYPSSSLSGNKLNFFGKTKLINCSNFHVEVA